MALFIKVFCPFESPKLDMASMDAVKSAEKAAFVKQSGTLSSDEKGVFETNGRMGVMMYRLNQKMDEQPQAVAQTAACRVGKGGGGGGK
eukprot:3940049-Rhodomonas_salina.2